MSCPGTRPIALEQARDERYSVEHNYNRERIHVFAVISDFNCSEDLAPRIPIRHWHSAGPRSRISDYRLSRSVYDVFYITSR